MEYVADILVLTALVVHILTGMHRGFLASILGVLGVVCAAVAGHLWAAPASDLLRDLGADPLASAGLGGALVFLCVSLLFALVSWGFTRRRRHQAEEEVRAGPSFVSRLAGGVVGLAVGAVFVLVLLWTYDAVRGGLPGLELPDISSSRSAAKARDLVSAGASRVLEDRVEGLQAAALAASVASPGATLESLAGLLGEPPVEALLNDAAFREDVLSGEEARVAGNAALLDMMRDPAVSGRLVVLGFAAEPYRPESVAADWSAPLADLGARLHRVLEDPEVAEALAGLREEGMFEDRDWKTLVSDPRTRLIAWKALSTEKEATEGEE